MIFDTSFNSLWYSRQVWILQYNFVSNNYAYFNIVGLSRFFFGSHLDPEFGLCAASGLPYTANLF